MLFYDMTDIFLVIENHYQNGTLMTLLTWGDKYKVNVKEIDDQHLRLVEIINKLYDKFSAGERKAVVEEIFPELANYAQYHFETEEHYLTLHHYPEFQSHKSEHEAFVKKLDEFRFDMSERTFDIPMKALLFLRDWLVSHVLGTDKRYSAFLNEKGVV